MILKRVAIANYRSISSAVLGFDSKCRILLGVNESGKSNLLKALSLLDADRKPTPDDVREFGPDEDISAPAYVRFIFSLEREDYEHSQAELEQFIITKTENPFVLKGKKDEIVRLRDACFFVKEIFYEVDVRTGRKRWCWWKMAKDQMAGYSVFGSWKTPTGNPESFSVSYNEEEITVDAECILDDDVEIQIESSAVRKTTPEDFYVATCRALIAVCKDKLPECIYWSYSDRSLLPGRIPMEAFAENPDSCRPLMRMFLLAGVTKISEEFQNAGKRTNGVQNLLDRVSKATTKHLHRVWNEAKGVEIELRQNGNQIDAVIRDSHNMYDCSRRSDGFKRFLTFLLLISARNKANEMTNVLYLQDEPELGLHPAGARHLCSELLKISLSNYVVFSTHSIFMIDRENIGRHLLVRKEKETTQLEEVGNSEIQDEEVLYRGLGYSMFEILKLQNLVFEGWKDKRLFELALQKGNEESRQLAAQFEQVGRCHANGVKDISRVVTFLDLAKRSFLIVTDSDQVAHQHKGRFDRKSFWFMYGDLLVGSTVETVEDLISSDHIKQVIVSQRAHIVELDGLNPNALDVDSGRLKIIKNWLVGKGIANEMLRERLETIKDAIFETLKPADISPRYFEALRELAKKIEA